MVAIANDDNEKSGENKVKKTYLLLGLLAFTTLSARYSSASAQEFGGFDRRSAQQIEKNDRWTNWDITIGAGAFYEPVSPGVDEYETEPLPFVDITYKDRYFANVYRGLGAYLYKSPEVEGHLIEEYAIGVAIDYDEGRDADDFEDNLNLQGYGKG